MVATKHSLFNCTAALYRSHLNKYLLKGHDFDRTLIYAGYFAISTAVALSILE